MGEPPVITRLQQLSAARQINVLRLWLSNRGVQSSARQLDALLAQIDACRTRGHAIDLKVGRGFVRRIGDLIDWYNF